GERAAPSPPGSAKSLAAFSLSDLLGALYLHQRLVRRDAVALLHVDADDDAADRRLDLVLHLHGLDHKQAVARFDGIADPGLDVDDGAGHGRGHAALVRR